MKEEKKGNSKKSSRKKFTNRFKELRFIDGNSKNKTYELRNTSVEKVSFCRGGRKRATVSNAERIFENINSSFDESSVTIKIIPMLILLPD